MREVGSGTRMSCDLFFKNKRISPNVRLTLGSNEAIKHAVGSGLGLSIVSMHSLTEHDLKVLVSVLNMSDFPIKSQWHIVSLKGKKMSPIAQIFHDHLLEKVSEINESLEHIY